MITREDYMKDSKNLHQSYWVQFATPEIKEYVIKAIGSKRIIDSKDEYFNDIPLKLWDNLYFSIPSKLLKDAGEWNTLSAKVCIAKAIARELKEQGS